MAIRKIVIYSTKTGRAVSLETPVSTWAELRSMSEMSSLLNESMTATIVETKTQLVDGDSILPTGDFKLVLTPTKTKAGTEVIDVAAVVLRLKEEFNEAFNRVMEEIEEGEHSTEIESSGNSSVSSDQLQALKNFSANL